MDSLVRITDVFSEAVYTDYKKKKYGFKNCSNVIDMNLADDLWHLLTRAQEIETCTGTSIQGCSLAKIEERINTI